MTVLHVTFKPNSASAARIKAVHSVGGAVLYEGKSKGLKNICIVVVPDDKVAALSSNTNVVSVDRDSNIKLFDVSVDAVLSKDYAANWGVGRINAQQVHATGNRGEGSKVAVLDTGSWIGHPDLTRAGEFDAISPGTPVTDGHGHGSHTHGIIGSQINGVGSVGVAPGASIYPVKVLDDNGSGAWSTIIIAVDWCIQNGMNIMSCSFGGGDPGSAVAAAFQAADDAGIHSVCSAGNSSGGAVGFPAALTSCISVVSTDQNDASSSYNSLGDENEVAGPGRNIRSAWKDGEYRTISGTSMAAPHVSGIMALAIKAGVADPRSNIPNAVVDLGQTGRDRLFGYGLLMADLMVGAPANPVFDRNILVNSSKSTDEDGTIIEYWFNMGDGSTPIIQDTPIHDYTYSEDGIFLLRVAVKDDKLLWSVVEELTVEIKKQDTGENVRPVCRFDVSNA